MQDISIPSAADWPLIVPLALIVGFLIYGWHETSLRTAESDRRSKIARYNKTLLLLWGLAFACLLGWWFSGRNIQDLGFVSTEAGWRGWTAWGFAVLGLVYFAYCAVTLRISQTARDQVRTQLNQVDLDFMRPRTQTEHRRFSMLSFTAGVTEEIIFRGFLIGFLALHMPIAFAAFTAIVLFGLGHIYQGLGGVLQTAFIGAFLTIVFLIGGSLWPVILLHILIDLTAGTQFRLIDKYADLDHMRAS